MTQRFTVEVERTGDGFVATSPEHPRARGHGATLASAIARLGEAIDGQSVSRDAETRGQPGSEQLNEEGCGSPGVEVKWTETQPGSPVGSEDRPVSQTNGARPTVENREHGRPVPGAFEWLNEHAEQYVGRWVALRDGRLLADAASFADLERRLDTLHGVFVTRVT